MAFTEPTEDVEEYEDVLIVEDNDDFDIPSEEETESEGIILNWDELFSNASCKKAQQLSWFQKLHLLELAEKDELIINCEEDCLILTMDIFNIGLLFHEECHREYDENGRENLKLENGIWISVSDSEMHLEQNKNAMTWGNFEWLFLE